MIATVELFCGIGGFRSACDRLGIKTIWANDKNPLSCQVYEQVFGPNEIRSTKFDVRIKGGNLVLNGMGWGHGVGMCQWGAYGMSLRGKKCDEILKYYYPGTEITTIDKLPLN